MNLNWQSAEGLLVGESQNCLEDKTMAQLTTNRWAFGLRGVAAIAFGVFAFIDSGATLAALILLFGAYAVLDGISSIAAGVGSAGGPRWLMILAGLGRIVIGVIAFVRPDITALSLLFLIGYWAILVGISQIVTAYRMRQTMSREWLLAATGVLAAAFGIYILVFPGAGALTLIWLIAWYAILSGVMLLTIGVRLRRRSKTHDAGSVASRRPASRRTMLTRRARKSLHHVEGGWFSANWHFSFDDYDDPENTWFGDLRVFNDDTLVPGAVWPMHPHRDIEGITYVAEGLFEHDRV